MKNPSSGPKSNKRLLSKIAKALALTGLVSFSNWVRKNNRQIDTQETRSIEDDAPGQFVLVHGFKIHVRVLDNPDTDPTGVPLVLLHGWSVGGGETWYPWAYDLAKSRSLIILDMLGLGHSERVTRPVFEYTHRGQAKLLVEVLEALGVTRFDLVGRSLGGAMSTEIALDFPDRVRRLVLMDASIYDNNHLVKFLLGLGELFPGRQWVVARREELPGKCTKAATQTSTI